MANQVCLLKDWEALKGKYEGEEHTGLREFVGKLFAALEDKNKGKSKSEPKGAAEKALEFLTKSHEFIIEGESSGQAQPTQGLMVQPSEDGAELEKLEKAEAGIKEHISAGL